MPDPSGIDAVTREHRPGHGTIDSADVSADAAVSTDRSKTVVMVVLVLAGVAVLAAVVVLAMGRGGELARTHPDVPPLPLINGVPVTGPEVAMLRLPRALWGYQMGITDEALHRLAYALTERDARMAALEQHIADLQRRLDESAPPRTARENGQVEGYESERGDGFEEARENGYEGGRESGYEGGRESGYEGGREAFGDAGGDRFEGGGDSDGREPFEGGPDGFGSGHELLESGRELLEDEKSQKR
ncbi:hypothetical protein [Actinomadura rupiterrae]|uniref:hypothetical protein n=1 Tax=Actinomadura rupiterrae TaxID=559627 RepID=UPI0020A46CBD|nr:hypothetical protein [Actinomadura rupiterrae]MCP2336536.1 putative membrane protein YgcG [Actinomadura rupiterrae]